MIKEEPNQIPITMLDSGMKLPNLARKEPFRYGIVGRPLFYEDPLLLMELRAQGFSMAEIGRALRRNPSSLSKYLHRHYLWNGNVPRNKPDLSSECKLIRASMISQLRSGWRPKKEQLLYYGQYKEKGLHSKFFKPLERKLDLSSRYSPDYKLWVAQKHAEKNNLEKSI